MPELTSTATTSDQHSLWFQVEQEIANLLLNRLEHMQITPERAAQIARFVVKTIPQQMTDKQMMGIVSHLDDEFVELASVVQKHLDDYEKTNEPVIEHKVDELMKHGQFQEAVSLIQKYFEHRI